VEIEIIEIRHKINSGEFRNSEIPAAAVEKQF